MPYASSRKARIHYESHGSLGPVVVLLQGLGLSGRFWFDTPKRLTERALKPYRVLAVDTRGTGKSDKPRGAYRMRDLADDVAAVLDHAAVDSALVAGFSLGGMIAQHVALRHPSRVRGLALMATTAGLPHGRLPQARALATLISVPFFRGKGSTTPLFRLILPDAHLDRAHELLKDWPLAMSEDPIGARGFFGQLLAAATHSTGFSLGKISCPVLIVTGDDDVLVPERNSHFLASGIRNSRLRVMRGMGHGLSIQDPGLVERVLDDLVDLCEVA